MAEDQNAIRREIEDTREQMAETIDAIGYRADVPGRTRERLTHVRESVVDRTDSVLSSVKGAAERMTGSARDTMSQTRTDVRQGTSQVTDRARLGVRDGVRVARDNPLVLALGAMAAGFLLGILLPGTRMEDERVGPPSERLKRRAVAKGEETIELATGRAKTAMEQTVDRADVAVERARSGGASTSMRTME